MKLVYRFAFLLAGLTWGLAPVNAQTNPERAPTTKQPAPKVTEKAKAPARKPAAKKPEAAAGASDKTPELADMHPTPYDCDLGDSLTLYKKPDDDQQIALQWKKRTHQLTRVPTTTGAERYENPDNGWVWIGIPSKGMLLDSKQGRQLANECRSEEQKKLVVKN
jgi:hypothetical protein